MTASTAIESAWDSAVWTQVAITGITSNIHKFPVTALSEFEWNRARVGAIINFIDVTTTRAARTKESASLIGRTTEYQFTVTVNYTKEIVGDALSYQAVRDFFETLLTQVVSGLGDRWTDTVDLWRPQTTPPSISETTLDNRKCWRGTYSFIGTKLASAS